MARIGVDIGFVSTFLFTSGAIFDTDIPEKNEWILIKEIRHI